MNELGTNMTVLAKSQQKESLSCYFLVYPFISHGAYQFFSAIPDYCYSFLSPTFNSRKQLHLLYISYTSKISFLSSLDMYDRDMFKRKFL